MMGSGVTAIAFSPLFDVRSTVGRSGRPARPPWNRHRQAREDDGGRRHPSDVLAGGTAGRSLARAGDAAGAGSCHTGSVNPAPLSARWHSGLATLRARTPAPARLSRGAWIADSVLAIVMAGTTIRYTLRARTHLSDATQVTGGLDVSGPTGPAPIPGFPGLLPEGVHPIVVGPAQLILAAMTGLPLALRRRYPLAVFWVVLSATLLFHVSVRDPDTALFTFASCLIAAYSAAVYSPYRAATIASIVIGAALLGLLRESNVPDVAAGYLPVAVVLGVGLVANTIHRWSRRVATLQAEREVATREAVVRERARIARELHDVVSHTVAVMLVQAGAARTVIDSDPDQAKESLLAVEASGRTALTELRQMMGLLTSTAHPDGTADPAEEVAPEDLAPQPGLDQLPALTDRVITAGVPVELAVSGTPVALPAEIDLAAYRVVQEALTNAVKHAGGARVRVAVDYRHTAVDVDVTDTGRSAATSMGDGRPDADPYGGHGLIGLRERLALCGGTLQAGPNPTGGYRVHASIPVPQ